MACLTEDLVLARVQGELPDAERAEVDGHLDACEACRQLVAAVADVALPSAVDPTAPDLGRADTGLLPPGTRIGRYVVEEPLGGGAMGVVYAGRHETLERPVALKVARSGDHAQAEQLQARLLREARAASAIRHPNVVTVHDVLTTDQGQPVIVMDRLEGRTLRRRLADEGPLSPAETVRLMDQVLAALGAAHAAGVVHRDLKPDNVFLVAGADGQEEVRLVDFGIAKLTAVSGPTAQSAGLTVTGMLVGTPHYMAPEQAFAEPVDPRTDLWAVGVMLYECLSDRRPVRGDQVGQILRRLARLDLVPLAEACPGCPTPLIELVDGLLVERDERPADAESLRRALATITSSAARHVSLRPPEAVDAVADTLAAHEAAPRRTPAWRPLALTAAITLLGIGLVVPRLAAEPVGVVVPALGQLAELEATAAAAPAPAPSAPARPAPTNVAPAVPTPPAPAALPPARRRAPAPSSPPAPAPPRPGQVIVDPPF